MAAKRAPRCPSHTASRLSRPMTAPTVLTSSPTPLCVGAVRGREKITAVYQPDCITPFAADDRSCGSRAGAVKLAAWTYKNWRTAMKIVIAPDSFKDSLSAADVASAVARGLRLSLIHI